MAVRHKIIVGICAFVFAFSVFGAVSHVALAQDKRNDYVKPMPEMAFKPISEFEAETSLHEETPPDYENLKYRIRFPKNWKKVEGFKDDGFSFGSKIFKELVTFYSPPRVVGQRSKLTVQVLKLDFKLTAQQWLIQHLLSSGSTMEGFEVHSENRVEALQVILDKGETYIVRSLAEINGGDLAFVQYFLPIDFWEEEKILQAQTIDSFSLLNRVDAEFVEEMEEFDFLDVAKLTYPSSWDIRFPPLRSVDVMEASLLNVPIRFKGQDSNNNASVDGKIELKLVSAYAADSLEAEIGIFEDDLQAKGLSYGDEVEIEGDYIFNNLFDFGRVRAYKIEDRKDRLSDYEIWPALLSAADYFYFVTLYTPSREEDYALWSRNTQTYKLILQALSPKADSIAGQ